MQFSLQGVCITGENNEFSLITNTHPKKSFRRDAPASLHQYFFLGGAFCYELPGQFQNEESENISNIIINFSHCFKVLETAVFRMLCIIIIGFVNVMPRSNSVITNRYFPPFYTIMLRSTGKVIRA